MKYINNTPIVKDSSELKEDCFFAYDQVFIQNKEKIKLVIHYEIFPLYVGENETNIIPNDSVFYDLMDNDNNFIARYYSLYRALCEFYKLK